MVDEECRPVFESDDYRGRWRELIGVTVEGSGDDVDDILCVTISTVSISRGKADFS